MTKLSKRTKRISTAIAVVAIVGAGGGAAWAYWSSSGSGVGAGSTGTSAGFTVASSTAVGAALQPGVGLQTVAFTVTNPTGAGHQILSLVTVAVANADGTTWVPTGANAGCSSADYSVSVTTAPAYADMAPGGTLSGTATLTMNDNANLQDDCKLAPVPLYFHAS